MHGFVISLTERGFFFIKGEDGRQYFGHKSALERPYFINRLEEGDDVEFEPTDAEKGPRAEAIRVPRLQKTA